MPFQVFEEGDAVSSDAGLNIGAAFPLAMTNNRVVVVGDGFSDEKDAINVSI